MKKLIISSIFIVILLVIAEIVFSCQLVAAGGSMKQADAQITALKQEEALLSEQIASASSLLTIASKAKDLGFVAVAPVVTIRQDQFSVAMNPAK